jgi:hypothetical protein
VSCMTENWWASSAGQNRFQVYLVASCDNCWNFLISVYMWKTWSKSQCFYALCVLNACVLLHGVTATTEYIGRNMLPTFFAVGSVRLLLHCNTVTYCAVTMPWYITVLPDVNEWKKYY